MTIARIAGSVRPAPVTSITSPPDTGLCSTSARSIILVDVGSEALMKPLEVHGFESVCRSRIEDPGMISAMAPKASCPGKVGPPEAAGAPLGIIGP